MVVDPAKSPQPNENTARAPDAAGAQRAHKTRLDVLLVERGLCESREQARRLIMAGEVSVGTDVVDKPGKLVLTDAELAVKRPPRYVSRGGLKLEEALRVFSLDVRGMNALDVGASTGGFTDCLLQHGAAHVYAIDVGYGQIAWSLRTDPRVTSIERTNIRRLTALPGGVLADLAVIDASFISLALVLPPTLGLLATSAPVIALVKPQFEAGRDSVGKGGVVRDSAVHTRVLRTVAAFANSLNLVVAGLTPSPVRGPAGNVEFLIWLRRNGPSVDVEQAIEAAVRRAQQLVQRGDLGGDLAAE